MCIDTQCNVLHNDSLSCRKVAVVDTCQFLMSDVCLWHRGAGKLSKNKYLPLNMVSLT